MEELTRIERLFLETVLKKEIRNTKNYIESNPETLESFLARNESLPMLESLLEKIKV